MRRTHRYTTLAAILATAALAVGGHQLSPEDSGPDAVDAALARAPDDVYLRWLRAMVTALAFDSQQGREQLEEVFEGHRFPDRARRSYRLRQRALAARLEVSFADTNELLRNERSDEEAAALYLDWCHPAAAGHGVIAAQLLEWIAP